VADERSGKLVVKDWFKVDRPSSLNFPPQILGWRVKGLHEILLLISYMYRNMRWEHFPRCWLFRNRI